MVFELLGLLPPEVVLHHIDQQGVVVVEILLRVVLVRHLGAGRLHHAGHSDGLDLLIVHVLRPAWVDDWLGLYDGLPVNSVVEDLLGEVRDGAGDRAEENESDEKVLSGNNGSRQSGLFITCKDVVTETDMLMVSYKYPISQLGDLKFLFWIVQVGSG